MPRIGGREAFERMRARCPVLRALFVTGYGADYDLHADPTGLPANTTLLRKPYQVAALNQAARHPRPGGSWLTQLDGAMLVFYTSRRTIEDRR